jgi:hypothetical protein
LALAIIGLSGVVPSSMWSVGGIALGLAFVTLAGIGTAWARTFQFSRRESRWARIVFFGGLAAVLIAGLAGIVLGILNLAFVPEVRFGAPAVILLGLGLLSHSAVMWHVNRFSCFGVEHGRLNGPLAINALSVAPARDFVVGLAAVVLGIVAIMEVYPMTVGLVALLAMGAAITFTTSTLCGATLADLEGQCSTASTERIPDPSKRSSS